MGNEKLNEDELLVKSSMRLTMYEALEHKWNNRVYQSPHTYLGAGEWSFSRASASLYTNLALAMISLRGK